MRIVLTEFAKARLFDSRRGGSRLEGTTPDEFEHALATREPEQVLGGYADFCKLHVHRNWTPTRAGAMEITPANEHQLRSAYEARTPEELPVLTRWLEGIEVPVAKYLLVIVYSREHLAREDDPIDAEWGVVGVLATMEPVEPPMAPITMLRNALGPDEGGSGVPIDRDAYGRSVEYWSRHANVRPTPETAPPKEIPT